MTVLLDWLTQTNGVFAPWHLGICIAAAGLAYALPFFRTSSGRLFLSVTSSILILQEGALGLLLISSSLYGFILASRRGPLTALAPQTRWRRCYIAILAAMPLFLALRWWFENAMQTMPRPVVWAAIAFGMWTLLRFITLLWEVGSGKVDIPSLSIYLAWLTMPFTLAGPLFRYSEFERQYVQCRASKDARFSATPAWWKGCGAGAGKLVLGLLLGFLWRRGLPSYGVGQVGTALGLGLWSWYFVAAGYYQLMERLAELWGFTLPRSFDKPFGRPNVSEFWARWNMSATFVFRDYIFFNRWGRRRMHRYVNVTVLFLAVGAWHGLYPYWLTWGLMQALGFAAYLWWKTHKDRFNHVRNLIPARRREQLSIGITYAYLLGCWILPTPLLRAVGLLH